MGRDILLRSIRLPDLQRAAVVSVRPLLYEVLEKRIFLSTTFTDNFTRADSTSVGNGWSDLAGNTANFGITNNKLTTTATNGSGGIDRPELFDVPITITLRAATSGSIGQMGAISILNDGTIGDGYGIRVYTGSDPRVVLFDGSTDIATDDFQSSYGSFGHTLFSLTATFSPDGSVKGGISWLVETEGGGSFTYPTFSFSPQTIQSRGSDFAYWAQFADASTTTEPQLSSITLNSANTASTTVYSLTDLGAGANSSASGINTTGQVVGNSPSGPFVWSSGSGITTFGTLPTDSSSSLTGGIITAAGANAISSNGTVVGTLSTNNGLTEPFEWTAAGGYVLLEPGARNAEASAINSLGEVVGASGNGAIEWSAAGVPTSIAVPVWNSWATSINDSGNIVGYLIFDERTQALIWPAGRTTATNLPDLGANIFRTQPASINSNGQIVGEDAAPSGAGLDAFSMDDGNISDLGRLGGTFSEATAINDGGVIVGNANTAAGATVGFVYSNGVMSDLNTMLDASGSGWTVIEAAGINGSGDIVATAVYDGIQHAILLTPDVAPTTPQNLTASNGTYTDHVHLTWDTVVGAGSYQVWQSTTNDSSTATELNASVATNSYDDYTATPGTTYYYWVTATESGQTSDFSLPASGYATTASFAAPTNVQASNGTYSDHVHVTWATAASATSYEVWSSTTDDSTTATELKGNITGTLYDDDSPTPGTTNYYWVKADYSGGTSDFSTPAAAGSVATTGNLVVTAHRASGALIAGAKIIRYDASFNPIDNMMTSKAGTATWSNVPSGTYHLELYAPNGDFWASSTATVVAGVPTNISLVQNEPYESRIRVFSGTTNLTAGTIPAGTPLTFDVTVHNNTSAAQVAQTFLNLYEGGSSTFGATDPSLTVAPNSTKEFTFNYTPTVLGNLTANFTVKTSINGKYVETDSGAGLPLVTLTNGPRIAALVANPNPLVQGTPFTMTAQGVAGNQPVSKVVFYRDATGNGVWNTNDPVVASGTQQGANWISSQFHSLLLNPGKYVYFARAQDTMGRWSAPAAATVTVTDPNLSLHVDNTSNLAVGSVSAVSGTTKLTASLIAHNVLALWMNVSYSTSGSATANPPVSILGGFAKVGLIPPEGNIALTGTFAHPNDQVVVKYTFGPLAGAGSIMDVLFPTNPIKTLNVTPAAIASLLQDISQLSSLRDIFSALTHFNGNIGTTALRIGTDMFQLLSNGQQISALKSAFATVGITITQNEINALLNISTLTTIARTLLSVAVLDGQLLSNVPISSTFTADIAS
jgi:probable HAF family extracellular repeat protein